MDLSLVPTEELVEELERRHDGLIVGVQRNIETGFEDSTFWYKGGLFKCAGLADKLKSDIMADIQTHRIEQ